MTNEARRTGRPRKPADHELVALKISRQHLEMIDALAESGAELAAMGLPATAHTRHERASLRRKFIEALIERAAAPDARWPGRVRITAAAFGKADELREAADWIEAHEARLTADAPPAIKRRLARNRLWRLADSDPAAFDKAIENFADWPADD